MINQNHLERLIELDFNTGVGIEVLLRTVTKKAIDYVRRDTNGFSYSPVTAHYNRALNVMEEYASRKLANYNAEKQ